MKKLFFISVLTFLCYQFFGQSNTFPSTGNVGIGTTSPRSALDVTSGSVWLTANGTSSSNDLYAPGHIYLIPRSTGIAYIQARRSDNSGSTELQFRTYNNGVVNEALRINSLGNVGIGTTTPSYPLQINSNNTKITFGYNTAFSGSFVNLYNSVSGSASMISMAVANSNYMNGSNYYLKQNWAAIYGNDLTAGLLLNANLNNYMSNGICLLNNGKVGIGTTTPTEKLTVNGNIKAEGVDIIADVPASDYVFEADYKLRSLSEVEQFVTENKHLPEVPSAAEFKENGYSVGQMDDILLRKVEELTLYIIEQQKQIELLRNELQNLKEN